MVSLNKKNLRISFLQKRKTLSETQRKRASQKACVFLYEKTKNIPLILSFVNLGSEIDLYALNHELAKENRLALPRVEKEKLLCYAVSNLSKDLELGSFGILEPDATKCFLLLKKQIKLALVPGLAFDSHFHRIGYGKGFYDRFLKNFSYSIGVGFKEQWFPFSLPKEIQDQPLNELALF